MTLLRSHRDPNERYPVLRIASVVVAGLGAVELCLGTLLLLIGLYAIASVTPEPPRGAPLPLGATVVIPLLGRLSGSLAVLFSLAFLVSGLQFLAMGVLLRLAIHVEENTRATAQSVEKLESRLERREAPDGAESWFVS